MTAGVLLLAAGSSRRFGGDKRRSAFNGQTLLECTLTNIRSSGLPCLLCLRTGDTDLASDLAGPDVQVLRIAGANAGMGATLAEAIVQTPPQWQTIIVALGDMPWVLPETYRTLANSAREDRIAVPVFHGADHGRRRGNPVAFGRDFVQEIARLGGDVGARQLLQEHAERLVEIPVKDPGILRDVDVPADLHA